MKWFTSQVGRKHMMNTTLNKSSVPFLFEADFSQEVLTAEEKIICLQQEKETLEAVMEERVSVAFAEGETKGRTDEQAKAAKLLSEHMEILAQTAKQLLECREDDLQKLKCQASQLALIIGSHLGEAALERYPHEELQAMLEKAMADLCEAPQLVLHVSQTAVQDIQPLVQKILDEQGYTGRIRINPQEDMHISDFRLVWAQGHILRDFEEAQAVLKKEVSQYFEVTHD